MLANLNSTKPIIFNQNTQDTKLDFINESDNINSSSNSNILKKVKKVTFSNNEKIDQIDTNSSYKPEDMVLPSLPPFSTSTPVPKRQLSFTEVVWNGKIQNGNSQKFTGSCVQIGGVALGNIKKWEHILPAVLNIDGIQTFNFR